jgi:hypothetical protein
MAMADYVGGKLSRLELIVYVIVNDLYVDCRKIKKYNTIIDIDRTFISPFYQISFLPSCISLIQTEFFM